MSDRHVRPAESGWHVEKVDAKRPSATAATQAEAVQRAMEIVANDGGGQVVVHGRDGAVRETRTVEPHATGTTLQAAATTAAATAEGARATAREAAGAVEDTAREVAGTAGDAAEDVGNRVRETAVDVGEHAGAIRDEVTDAAKDVAGNVAAAGRRARDEVADLAEDAGDALVENADRAAEVGAGLGDRLAKASQQTGQYIHAVTESAAGPLDRAARALNPVRVAGRTLGVAVAGALHVGAVVSSRGTRRAQRSARALTGRR